MRKEWRDRIIIATLVAVFAIIGWLQSQKGEGDLIRANAPEDQIFLQKDPSTDGSFPVSQPAQGDRAQEEASSSSTNRPASSEEETVYIFVHVDGCVDNPGLYRLEEGSRVQDAIDRAGGLADEADTEGVNLAAKLKDEMKIRIPSREEMDRLQEEGRGAEILSRPGHADEPGSEEEGTEGETDSGKVNINKASLDELMTLPSIGQKKAESIIAYREVKAFESLEELMEVSGIGSKIFEQIRDLISLD